MGESKLATAEDLPDHLVGERLNGEVYPRTRPSGPHARASSALGMELGEPFQRGRGGPGGWWVLDEPELHLGGHVLVPDLAGWRLSTLPRLPRHHRFTIRPDWVCEILSPRSAHTDRIVKTAIYASLGIPYLWLIDPLEQTLEVRTLHGAHYTVIQAFGGPETVHAEPFAAAPLELDALWEPLDAP
jgi:Uma2 family endonuclease